jgi:hypothetical protein
MFEAIAGGGAAGLTQAVMMRRRAKRYVQESKAELGLRVLDGAVAGLRGKWLTGFATLSPGQLVFTSYVGGIRIIRRQPVTVPAPYQLEWVLSRLANDGYR